MTMLGLVACDKCHRTMAQNYDEERIDLIDRADNNGWVSIRRHGTWQNVCPECADTTTNTKEGARA